jgi:hypothetical protein
MFNTVPLPFDVPLPLTDAGALGGSLSDNARVFVTEKCVYI